MSRPSATRKGTRAGECGASGFGKNDRAQLFARDYLEKLSIPFVSGAGQIYLWPSGEGRSYMMIETSPFWSSVTSST